MKITNLFKKEIKKVSATKVETIEKKQLAKVIGGGDEAERTKTRSTQGTTFGGMV